MNKNYNEYEKTWVSTIDYLNTYNNVIKEIKRLTNLIISTVDDDLVIARCNLILNKIKEVEYEKICN